MNRFKYTVAAIALLAPTSAFADETMGVISAVFYETPMEWRTIAIDDEAERDSTATLYLGPGFETLSLQGVAENAPTIVIEVLYFGTASIANAPTEVLISVFPGGFMERHWTSEDVELRQPEISFSTLDYTIDGGTAEGTFAALLCARAGFDEVDLNDCTTIEGQFSTRFAVQE
ncbi:MAG: hypothetical protein KIT43_08425 [Bauldia sp.]|nr:hypothetical protein [Bauldia sp.]MCW5716850.1 hypothetical protein [Bauldia sp.]